MGLDQRTERESAVALIVAVCLVAANMRPTITAIGPVLDQIGADTGLATGALGLIAAVPLVAWAVVSPIASDLSARFGLSRTVLWSLVLLTVGTVVRSLPGPTLSLWLGIGIIGVALAVVNVLMPAVIKRDFPGHVAGMMAVYTALLGGFGAVASGVVVPVSRIGEPAIGWRGALLITGGVLLPFAIAAWAMFTRGRDRRANTDTPARGIRSRIWRDPVAWTVAAYMALQSATFYMLVTWLATLSTSIGRSPVVAGFDVAIYQIVTIVGSLSVPLLLRGRAKPFVPALIPVLGIVGTIGLMVAPGAIVLWAVLLGLSSGASLGMSLTLMAQRARHHDASAALSGMAQSVGYVVAALGPVTFGALHAASGGWMLSLVLLLVVMVAQALTGVFAGRDRFVLERR